MKCSLQATVRRVLGVCVALASVVPGWAATATWTNTAGNASDYWTNNVNWNAASYPGSVVFDESAYLTNAAAGAYTNILDFTIGRRIATLAISNNLGEAWLVVTNAVLTNTTFAINSGGRLRIADGGMVTGITSFTWLGTNGVIQLDSGGRLFTSGNHAIGGVGGSVTGLVTGASGSGTAGVWNRNGGILTIGSASDNVLHITDGAVLTNVGGLTITGNRNSLVASNGGGVFGAGAIAFSATAGQNGNTIDLGVGAWSLNNAALNVGSVGNASNNSFRSSGMVSNVNGVSVGGGVGANNNSLAFTNGGSLVVVSGGMNIGAAGAAAGGHNNTLILSNSVINTSTHVYIGTGSTNNTVELLAGSVWNANAGGFVFRLGYAAGSSNVLTLNGGVLTNVSTLQIGGGAGAAVGNQLIVKNGGMLSNVVGAMSVGGILNAHGNSLIATDNASFFMNGLGVTIGGSGSGNNTVLLSNSVVRSAGLSIGSGGSNNVLTLLADTVWSTFGAAVTIGSAAAEGNVLTVDGAVVTNIGAVTIGTASSINNQLRIVNGGSVSNVVGGLTIGGGVGGNHNSLIATSGGTFFMTTGGAINIGANGAAAGGHGNLMLVSNSVIRLNGIVTYIGTGSTNNTVELLGNSVWDNDGALFRIGWLAGNNNSVTVDGGILSNVSTLLVGGSSTATGNRLIVKNGGSLSNITTISLGAQNGANNNALVADGGQIFMGAGNLTVGGGTSIGNSVVLSNGALLQANGLITAGGAGNTISNVNSTYQFTIGTPTVTVGSGAGSIAITDGTISFLGTALNLTNNWRTPLANIAFAGDNTLRLDNSTATNTVAVGYTFNTGLGATNYYRLEMVNGTTAIRGNGISIGTAGMLLASNTTAIFAGVFTNAGTVRVVASTATFDSAAHLTGTNRLRSSTVTLNGLTGTGVFSNEAGNSSVVFNSGNATFAGSLHGTGLAVTMSGGNQTLTSSSHSYSGATTVSGGTLTLANSGGTALSLSAITVNGGNLVVRNSGGTGIGTNFTVTSGAVLVTNSAGIGIGANVAVNGGALRINNTGGSAVGAGNTVSLNSGGRLTGGGEMAGGVVVNNNGTIAPGNGTGGLGVLTLGTLALSAGSRLEYEFSGGNNDQVLVTATDGLTINSGGFRLLQGDGVTSFDAAGLYNLIGYAGAIGGGGVGALSVVNATGNRTYNFGTAAGYVTLAIGGTGVGWNPGSLSADTYWTNPQNWNGGAGPAPVEFDQLLFDGFTKTANTNDFASGTRFSGIVFSNTAGSFVLRSLSAGSNSVNLLGDIVNLSAAGQSLQVPLVLEGGSRTVRTSAGSLTLAGVVSETGGTLGLIKAGSGLVTVSGNNTYSGVTEIQGGVLRADDSVGLPAGSNLRLNGGVLESAGTLSRSLGTAGGSVQWSGSGGFSAFGGTLSVNLGGSAAGVTWGSGNFVSGSGSLQFSSSLANSTVKFINPIDLNGAMRTVSVVNGSAIVDADIIGAITGGGGGLTKVGTGALRLSGDSTFAGAVVVSAGTLIANASISPGGALSLGNSTTLMGTGTIGRVISGSGLIAPGASPGILTVNQLDPSGGLDFNFEFTNIGSPDYLQPGASLNDVLRITNSSPFTTELGLANTVHLHVQTALLTGVTNIFRGGFYTDVSANFDASITGATFVVHGPATLVFVRTFNEPAFSQNGFVMEFGVLSTMVVSVIPEPNVLVMWLSGLITLYAARRRARR